ncbi:mucin-1-like [Oryza brachyantha]|uniref:mucin-1-like n=1 Tax=Oryza brachyantha TaxID=4533 RepID=UPI0003EAAC6A|nr:mucin-1-like [Oryza brachyantha]
MSFGDATAGNVGEEEANEAVDAGEEKPSRGDETPEPEEVKASGRNEAPAGKKPDELYLAEAAESETLPRPTAQHAALAPDRPDDADTVKPGGGCTTPPPPPAHDSEGSDTQSADDHGSPQSEKPRTASSAGAAKRDVAPSSSMSSRLLAFRSFSRDRRAKAQPADAAPSPGDHRPPAHGKARDEEGEHKEKGRERRRRFWK